MKIKSLLFVLFLAFANSSFAQEVKYQLSSHILDITSGKPAKEVKITLSKQDKSGVWTTVDEKYTDANGRVGNFIKQDGKNHTGIYRLTFHTKPYFEKNKQSTFYPFIEVVFELTDNEHYHVPITVSPFGYSTYRGS